MDSKFKRADLNAPSTPEQYRAALDRQERVIADLRKRLAEAKAAKSAVPEGWNIYRGNNGRIVVGQVGEQPIEIGPSQSNWIAEYLYDLCDAILGPAEKGDH